MTSSDNHWPHDVFVPAAVPATCLAYAADNNLPQDELLRQTDLEREYRAGFASGISMDKFRRLLAALYAHGGDDRLGFAIGWRMPPTSFGSLGNALLASPDLGSALAILEQYWVLAVRGVRINVITDNDLCLLTLWPEDYLTGAMQSIAMDSIVASLFRGATLLVPGLGERMELWLDHSAPAGEHEFFQQVRTLRFAMPLVQGRFAAELLSTPLPLASATGQAEALRHCEQQARLLRMNNPVSARVQQQLGYQAAGYPTLATLADQLGMTPRTLRRKLHAEGKTYSVLVEETRLRDAVVLLDKPELAIAQIAAMLGYEDAANFTRAFRRQAGVSPSEYRATARV